MTMAIIFLVLYCLVAYVCALVEEVFTSNPDETLRGGWVVWPIILVILSLVFGLAIISDKHQLFVDWLRVKRVKWVG